MYMHFMIWICSYIYVYTYKQYYYMYKSVYGPVASSLFLNMKYSHLKLGLVAPENYTH